MSLKNFKEHDLSIFAMPLGESVAGQSRARRRLLMIPGPTECLDEVLESMAKPPPAHYMDEFVTIYEEVIKILKQLFGTRSDVFLITGSGSAGLEASIISLIEPGDKVIADDYYLRFLEVVGTKVILLERGRGEAITPSMIERILKKEHDVKAVAIAHNDTAQGITNPINEIGEIVKNYGALFIVDAVSSLGGIPIKFDEWHIDICSSGAQKALSAPPGLAPIAVSERAWEVITNRKTPIPSRYLNLLSYREAVEKHGRWHPTPFTTATSLVVALYASLKSIMSEGLDKVYERHAKAAIAVRESLKAAGLKLLVKDERYASNTVTAVIWPEGYSYEKFWHLLYDKYRVMIGNPPVQWLSWPIFRGSFRIGHMGRTARQDHIMYTISAIENALLEISYPIKTGIMTEVAEKILT